MNAQGQQFNFIRNDRNTAETISQFYGKTLQVNCILFLSSRVPPRCCTGCFFLCDQNLTIERKSKNKSIFKNDKMAKTP